MLLYLIFNSAKINLFYEYRIEDQIKNTNRYHYVLSVQKVHYFFHLSEYMFMLFYSPVYQYKTIRRLILRMPDLR
jgi:hypothetical protein